MNPRNPITPPTIERLHAAAEEIGREDDCRLIVLFGSVARGEPRPADLDIGVLGRGLLDGVALSNRWIRALGIQAVDVSDLGRADPLLMVLVAREGIPLYEAEPHEFARFTSLAARRYADTRKFREMEHREIQELLTILPGEP